MPEDKQWFWTKFVGSLLGLFLLLSTGVGIANMHYGLERRVGDTEDDLKVHRKDDASNWNKAFNAIDSNRDDIHALELQNTRTETILVQIRLDGEKRDANIQHIIDILGKFEGR